MEFRKNFNQLLKELRINKKLTQKDVASALEISVSMYSKYEQGLNFPSEIILYKITTFFNLNSSYFLEENENFHNIEDYPSDYFNIFLARVYNLDNEIKQLLIDFDDRDFSIKKEDKALIEILVYNGFEFEFEETTDDFIVISHKKIHTTAILNQLEFHNLLRITKKNLLSSFRNSIDVFGEDWTLENSEILEKIIKENKD